VKLWDGYKGYKGSLPFDGRTIIEKIAEAGACLVFSSEAHINSDIMSNRLFEAMAAGAVVIGDEHSFIPAAIGDNFLCIPSTLTAEERAKRIVDALQRFGRHPQEAVVLATTAQQALIASYHLCTQLANVYEAAQRFTERSRQLTEAVAEPVVDLVVQPLVEDAGLIRDQINHLARTGKDLAKVTLIVAEKQKEWYERNVDTSVRIVPVAGSRDCILSPIECLELAGDQLTCSKVAFLLGIEELFVETFLTACLEAGNHPVARVGHVLRHRDGKGGVYYDYFRGAGEISDLHDAAIGCVIFDREWLANRVPLRCISWKDICRLAVLERQSVVDCPSTAIVIDLADYEQLLQRTQPTETIPLDPQTLARLAHPVKEAISSSALVVSCTTATAMNMEPSRGLNEDNMLSTVIGMEQEKRWRLLLNLYHSAPMPGWVRKSVTFIRKSVGIR